MSKIKEIRQDTSTKDSISISFRESISSFKSDELIYTVILSLCIVLGLPTQYEDKLSLGFSVKGNERKICIPVTGFGNALVYINGDVSGRSLSFSMMNKTT